MQSYLHRVGLFSQDREACLDIGRLQLGCQAPFKPRYESVLQVRNFRSGPVAGEHDLFMAIKKSVKSVKEFLLRSLLASEKLDVVNQENIGLAITLPEFDEITVLNRADEFVDDRSLETVMTFTVLLLAPTECPMAFIRLVFPRPTH